MTDDMAKPASATTENDATGDGGIAATIANTAYHNRQLLPPVKMANKQLYRNGNANQQTNVHGERRGRTLNGQHHHQLTKFNTRHQHMIRLIGQFLSRCGLENTANSLMRESGLRIEEDIACRLRHSILTGKWAEAEKHLLLLKPYIIIGVESTAATPAVDRPQAFVVVSTPAAPKREMRIDDAAAFRQETKMLDKAEQQDTLLKKMYFLVRERKFLELLEASKILDALLVLRNEIGTLNVNTERMHELAMCLMRPVTTPMTAAPRTAAITNGSTTNGRASSTNPRSNRKTRYRANKANNVANGNAVHADGVSLTSTDAASGISTSDTNDGDETDGGTDVDGIMLDGPDDAEDGGGDAAKYHRHQTQLAKVQPSIHSNAREALINVLQAFLPPGIMLPPDRLEVLVDQAVAYQMQRCTLHDCAFMTTRGDDSQDVDNVRFDAVIHGRTRFAAGSRDSTQLHRPGIRRRITATNGHTNDQIQNGSLPDGTNNHYQALPQNPTAPATTDDDDGFTSVDDEAEFNPVEESGSPAKMRYNNYSQKNNDTGHSRSYGLLTDHVCNESEFPSACIQTLRDHTDEVWYARFSNNGKFLATASRDGRVLVYAVDLHATLMARRIYTFEVARDSNAAMNSIAFLAWSPDDRYLAGCGQDGGASNVLIWNMEQGILHSRINRTAEDSLTSVAWRKCSRRLVMAGQRGNFFYSDLDGAPLAAWDGIRVQALAYGGCDLGRFFQPLRLSSGEDARSDSSLLAVPPPPPPPLSVDPGYGAGHSEDGNDRIVADPAVVQSDSAAVGLSDCYVLAADTHYRVRVYNFDAVPQPRDAALIQEDQPILSFSCNSSGRRALLNVQDQSLRVWDLYDRSLVRKYRGAQHGKWTIHSCFGGSREQFIASGSEDRHVYVWHVDFSEPVQVLRGHSGVVTSVHWNRAQSMLMVSSSDDHTVRLWAPRRFINEEAAAQQQQSNNVDEPMLADEQMMPSGSSDSISGQGGQSGSDSGSGSTLPPPPAAGSGRGYGGSSVSRFNISSPYESGGTVGSRGIGHLFRRGLAGSHHAGGTSSAIDLPMLFVPGGGDPNLVANAAAAAAAADAAAAAVIAGYGGGASGANMPYADGGVAALVAAGFSGSGNNNPSEQQHGASAASGGSFPDLRTPSSLFHRVITPTLAAANIRRNNAALVRDALHAAAVGGPSSGGGSGRGSTAQQQQQSFDNNYHLYPGGSTGGGAGRGSSSSGVFQSGASRLLELAFRQQDIQSRHQQLQQQQQLLQEQYAASSIMQPSQQDSSSISPAALAENSSSSSSMLSTLQNIVMQQQSNSAASAALRRSATAGGTSQTSLPSTSAAPFSQRYQQLLNAAGAAEFSGASPSIRFREAFGGEQFISGTPNSTQQQPQQPQQSASNEVSAALANILGSVEQFAGSDSSAGRSSFVPRYAGGSHQQSPSSTTGGNTGGALNFSLLNASTLSSASNTSRGQQHIGGALMLNDEGNDDDDEDESPGPTNLSASALFGINSNAAVAAVAANAAGEDDEDDGDTDDEEENADNDNGANAMHDANLDYEDDEDGDGDDDDDDSSEEGEQNHPEEESSPQQQVNNNVSSSASGGNSAAAAARRSTPPTARRRSGGAGSSGVGGSLHRADTQR